MEVSPRYAENEYTILIIYAMQKECMIQLREI